MKYISMDDIVDICQANITPLKANRQGVAVSALRRVIEAAEEYAVEAEAVKHGERMDDIEHRDLVDEDGKELSK